MSSGKTKHSVVLTSWQAPPPAPPLVISLNLTPFKASFSVINAANAIFLFGQTFLILTVNFNILPEHFIVVSIEESVTASHLAILISCEQSHLQQSSQGTTGQAGQVTVGWLFFSSCLIV